MTDGRDLRIDFFRGLALIFIFWDHVPDNPLGLLTVRNFGFSDAAEIFVFLAGYAAVLAYGRLARREGWLVASMRILRRTWVLYVVHIFLLTLLMGMVFFTNNHVETRDMVQQMGLEYFVGNPQAALADQLLLRFKPNLTDPLPLYILLLLALPLVLPLLMRTPAVAVGLSLVLYLMVPLLGWNLAAYNGGVWYFNPVAWQLLFILGGTCALKSAGARPGLRRPLRQQPLFLLAALYVVVAGVLTVSINWPTLHANLLPQWLIPLIYKTDLAPARLLHFLALAWCTMKLLPEHQRWLHNRPAHHICRMGRYSLEIFCFGVLLAPLADMANALAGDIWPMQIFTAVLGLLLMAMMASALEWNKQLNKSPRVAPA